MDGEYILFKQINSNLLLSFSGNRLIFFDIRSDIPEMTRRNSILLPQTKYIRKIVFKSNNYFIVITDSSLKTFFIDNFNVYEEDSFDVTNLQLQYGFYSNRNGFFYGMSTNDLYLMNLEEKLILCSFSNVRNSISGPLRYFRPRSIDFIHLLCDNNSSIYRTGFKMKTCVRYIYNTMSASNIQYNGIFYSFDIFSCHFQNKLYLFFFNHDSLQLINHIHLERDLILNYQICRYWNNLILCEFHPSSNGILTLKFSSLYPYQTPLFSENVVLRYSNSFIKSQSILFIHEQMFLFLISETETDVIPISDFPSRIIHEFYEHNKRDKNLLKVISSTRRVDNEKDVKQLAKCCSCLETNVNVVFFPCGHLCTCQNCSVKLNQCPLCRENIMLQQNVFVSTINK